MKVHTTTCWAHMAAARHARSEGHEQDLDEALEAYVQEHYGPPWVPEFIQEALLDMPYAIARQLAAASEEPAAGSAESMGSVLDSWIGRYARLHASRQFTSRMGHRHTSSCIP